MKIKEIKNKKKMVFDPPICEVTKEQQSMYIGGLLHTNIDITMVISKDEWVAIGKKMGWYKKPKTQSKGGKKDA